MRNDKTRNNEAKDSNNRTKIAVLSVLLVICALVFAANVAIWDKKPESGTAINTESAVFTAKDDNDKMPDNDIYSTVLTSTIDDGDTGNNANISPMGWWEDLWKIPEEIDVYGTVWVGKDRTTVASGSYTNKDLGYTAPSGFPKFQYGRAENSWDVIFESNSMTFSNQNRDGWYYFRGYKPNPKGDYTKVSRICLDTEKPQIQARIDGNSVASGTVTTSSSAVISVFGSDTLSGAESYFYTTNVSSGVYYKCNSNSTFSKDGVYTFYCVDRAGNVSDTVTVIKDTTAPAVKVYNGTSQISNGAIVSVASVSLEASDATTGVAGIYIKTPNSSSYSNYGTTAAFTTEGNYYYYARDNAGNQSATYSFTIDRAAPTVQLYSGTNAVSNGYYSSAGYIKFTATDANGIACYMKKDGGSYAAYTSGTNITAEGIYTFYALDPAGNKTSEYTITLDRTAPAGTLYAGGATISSGEITNAGYVTYTATDNLALNLLYVKRPGAASYVTFSSGTQFTTDGTYYFYSADKSGNTSSAVSVQLDRTKPTIAINAGTTTVTSGGYANKQITFEAFDATSGIAGMYVKLPNSSGYISYVAGTPFNSDGVYFFYAIDNAGNISETIDVTLDTGSPIGTITTDGATVPSGSYVNKAFRYSATDSISGISRYEIKRQGGAWSGYDGEEIPDNFGDGLYSFRAFDRAGNVSEESKVYLLTVKSAVRLYADEQPAGNGAYVNAARISMSADGGAEVTCYVKLPNANGFTIYNQYYTFSSAGRYEFYAIDQAGNMSDIFVIVIDREAKPVTIDGVNDGKTSGDVRIIWENDNPDTYAPIVSVTVNGVPYCNGNVIRTIDGGAYFIESLDAAGNVWTATFTAERTEVLSETLNKQYFETVDGSGKVYAFESYENALTFAKVREAALVRSDFWSGGAWDGGIPIDVIDGANAKNGAYYIYKKSGDGNIEVAYFTLERLDAVIAEYAKQSVKAYWWLEKAPAEIEKENDLYQLKTSKTFIGDSVTLADHAYYLIDGSPYFGLVYSTEGEHILTVYDDFGNSYEYILVIVRTAPSVMYKLTGGAFNKANDDRLYAFKEAVTLKIEDAFGGAFAMYVVRNGEGETVAVISCGEEYTLSNSGSYIVQAVNHAGVSEEIRLILSLDSPTVSFTENTDSKRLEVNIRPSIDGGATLMSVKIYKSTDGGLAWIELETDDYGKTISALSLFYEFNKDGIYRVVIEDNFRSGIDAVMREADYTKPALEGSLDGADDGGYTNKAVKFTWTDEAEARLTHNGKTAAYLSGSEITDEGEYVLEFFDGNGYCKIYMFTIDKTAPVGTLTSVTNGGITNKTVVLDFTKDAYGILYKGGVLIGAYESGRKISADGEYKIILTDRAGNVTEYVFTVDTVKPEATLVGVDDGGRTGGNVVLKNPNKPCLVKAYKDGIEFAYSFGDTLDREGAYKIVLTDDAGNVTEYGFEIVYAVNAAGTIVIIIVIAAVLAGAVIVLFTRKRKAFQSKLFTRIREMFKKK